MDTIPYKDFTIRVVADEDPPNPREGDNLGVMVCLHRRYELGDKHEIKESMFKSWEELQEHLLRKCRAKVLFPLYMLDHSGLTISTTSFNDPWDSGQIGFIYTTVKRMNECFGRPRTRVDRMNRDAKARTELRAEVDVYDAYIRGDCWGYVIEDKNGVHRESCWGYYSFDEALSQAKSTVDHM